MVALLGAGVGAGVGRRCAAPRCWRSRWRWLIVIVNALVTRDGLTVIVRLGQLPVLGHTDITLEATAYGAILGLRAVALILCGALYTAAVDPDEVLALFRRVSFRSALTATLATRMVPVLVRDSRRLADAQRCRPGPPPSRVALMRATSSGVLDRALDVAAALEVRGYGSVRKPPRSRRPYTRHDLAFYGAALAVPALAVASPDRGSRPVPRVPVAARRCRGFGCVRRVGAAAVRAAAVRRPSGDRAAVTVLELDRVSYRYPGRVALALEDVSLTVGPASWSSSRAARAAGSRRCYAPPAASFRTSTVAIWPGTSRSPAWTPGRTGRGCWPVRSARCSRIPRRRS